MHTPWIQVSVDTQDVPAGLVHVGHALAIDAEWIEVGTPLLTFAGIGSIRDIADAAAGKTVVADFKALDGVAQYFRTAAEFGAGVATVMAVANEASVLKAIETGRDSGVKIQVDMLGVPAGELAARGREMEALGADYLLHHLAIDELMRNPEADPLECFDQLVGAVSIPVGPVVFNADQGIRAVQRGASYVVIGYPLITMDNAREELGRFADAVRSASQAAASPSS